MNDLIAPMSITINGVWTTVNLKDFSYDDVCPEHIFMTLNNMPRFNGQGDNILSVAEHSVLTWKLAFENQAPDLVQLACLAHDMPEAYYGDITSPVKKLIGNFNDKVKHVDDAVFKVMFPGMKFVKCEEIKPYDNLSFFIEDRWRKGLATAKDMELIDYALRMGPYFEDIFYAEYSKLYSEIHPTIVED